MNCLGCLLLVICAATSWAQTSTAPKRREAEYYVAAYAQHYRVPVPLVRLSSNENPIGGRASFLPKAQSA
jgi:hypothetical protein